VERLLQNSCVYLSLIPVFRSLCVLASARGLLSSEPRSKHIRSPTSGSRVCSSCPRRANCGAFLTSTVAFLNWKLRFTVYTSPAADLLGECWDLGSVTLQKGQQRVVDRAAVGPV
jgi:hypothetical protein